MNGAVMFKPSNSEIQVVCNAKGPFSKSYYASEDIKRLWTNEFSNINPDQKLCGIYIEIKDGEVIRWCSDVEPHWIFERSGGDFVVLKNSGPVIVSQWDGL